MKKFNYVEGLPILKQLETDESTGQRFYILPSGKKLPSVTTVLGYFKKDSLKEWRNRVGEDTANRVSTRASIRGTKFHDMMEKYLRNDNGLFEGVMPDMKQSFIDCKKYIDNIDNIHYIEDPLYSEKLGVAGRTDCIGEYNGKLSIIDFKTSTKVKKREWITDYFIQGTAYSLMYEELVGSPIDNIVIIMSTDDHSNSCLVFEENKNGYVDILKENINRYYKENLLCT